MMWFFKMFWLPFLTAERRLIRKMHWRWILREEQEGHGHANVPGEVHVVVYNANGDIHQICRSTNDGDTA